MPSANGICARNIVSGLKDLGHSVDVICYREKDNQSNKVIDGVFEIDEKREARTGIIAKVIRLCRRIPGIIARDASMFLDENLVNSYYEALCELNAVRQVDAVVAMYFPMEGLQAAYLFKNRYPTVKIIDYELDSVGDGIANNRRQCYYNRIYECWLKKIYHRIDSIIVMESHKSYWENTFGDYLEKVKYADIPVLVRKDECSVETLDNYSMLYSGIIEKQYRSPTYLLETLIHLKEELNFTFTFFSKGDCEEEIESASQKYQGIKRCGFITPEELEEQIYKTDFLVSIGNSISRSLPSKIITYVSYGKPIIHFSSQTNDVCLEYLRRYPACLVVDQNESVENSTKRVCQFLKDYSGVKVSFEEIHQYFEKNDPIYSAKLIQSSLGLQ